MNKLNIKKITLGQMGANCYIIENGDHSIVIDPGDNGLELIQYIESLQIQIQYILLTHGHFDHIGAVDDLVNKYNCSVYIHENDYDMFYDDKLNLSSYYKPLHLQSKVIKVSEHLQLEQFKITFIHLPGHTKGSCFIVFDDYHIAFSGDVLFKGSIGRYDFPTSSIEDTKETIKKMYQMKINYTIYPGHGENTTLNDEKLNNPFFNS